MQVREEQIDIPNVHTYSTHIFHTHKTGPRITTHTYMCVALVLRIHVIMYVYIYIYIYIYIKYKDHST